MPQIGYLAHDLADAATARRAAMLRAGGANLRLAGFLRNESPLPESLSTDDPPVLLGRTRDAKLGARAVSVLNAGLFKLGPLAKAFADVDVLMARNLEMLVVATALRRRMARKRGVAPRLVYECLDIHRLLTSDSAPGRAVQRVERGLADGVDHVITSSPAFVRHHLGEVFDAPVTVVENKVPVFDDTAASPAPVTSPGPPWRIGWFGMLRCRRSFSLLADLARRSGGTVEVVLRGRPSPAEFPDFDALVAAVPGLSYGGPYDGADGLAEAYQSVHFAWCIDFFEEGQNSAWLLPNRLYESTYHQTVPIALRSVETGRRLSSLGAGIVVDDPSAIPDVIARMDAETYEAHLKLLHDQPKGTWSANLEDCRRLVQTVLGPAGQPATARISSRGSR